MARSLRATPSPPWPTDFFTHSSRFRPPRVDRVELSCARNKSTSREIPRAGKRYDFRGNDPEDFREPTRVSYRLAFFCQCFFFYLFDTRFYKIPSRFISVDVAVDVRGEKNYARCISRIKGKKIFLIEKVYI